MQAPAPRRHREDESFKNPRQARFHIETLTDPQVIGECEIELNEGAHGEAEVAIGIGEREFWSKGYGSDG